MSLFRALLVALLLLPSALTAGLAAEEASTGIALFDSNTLAGWQYGPESPRGWQMAEGVLRGEQGATPLLSGWTWGDVELAFRWSTPGGGELTLSLPEAPAGQQGLALTLAESDTRASLAKASKNSSPGPS